MIKLLFALMLLLTFPVAADPAPWATEGLWAPDGSKFASGHADGRVMLWDNEGRKLRQVCQHDSMISGLGWRGLSLVSVDREGTLRQSLKDEWQLRVSPGTNRPPVSVMQTSWAGDLLGIWGTATQVFDLSRRKALGYLPSPYSGDLILDPKHPYLAVRADGCSLVYELPKLKRVAKILTNEDGNSSEHLFLPDGKLLIVDSNSVRQFEIPSGKLARQVKSYGAHQVVKLSPDGRSLLISDLVSPNTKLLTDLDSDKVVDLSGKSIDFLNDKTILQYQNYPPALRLVGLDGVKIRAISLGNDVVTSWNYGWLNPQRDRLAVPTNTGAGIRMVHLTGPAKSP